VPRPRNERPPNRAPLAGQSEPARVDRSSCPAKLDRRDCDCARNLEASFCEGSAERWRGTITVRTALTFGEHGGGFPSPQTAGDRDGGMEREREEEGEGGICDGGGVVSGDEDCGVTESSPGERRELEKGSRRGGRARVRWPRRWGRRNYDEACRWVRDSVWWRGLLGRSDCLSSSVCRRLDRSSGQT
jgi:hypothetical protein